VEANREWEGFPGIVHGWIVSTVLGEAMSQAIVSRNWRALTCELRVRLHQHVAAGAVFIVRAWVVEKRKRRILAEAVLLQGNVEAAHAWGTFLQLTDRDWGS
jgi:acyl-coenzyme A thioesterase PaaI-like protein